MSIQLGKAKPTEPYLFGALGLAVGVFALYGALGLAVAAVVFLFVAAALLLFAFANKAGLGAGG